MNDSITSSGESITTDAASPRQFRPLRTWPAVLFVMLMLGARFGPALFEQGSSKYWMVAVFGPLLCCLLIIIWWVAGSRATWRERLFGFLGIIAAAALTIALAHPTMRGPG